MADAKTTDPDWPVNYPCIIRDDFKPRGEQDCIPDSKGADCAIPCYQGDIQSMKEYRNRKGEVIGYVAYDTEEAWALVGDLRKITNGKTVVGSVLTCAVIIGATRKHDDITVEANMPP